MNIKLTVDAYHPETGQCFAGGVRTFDEHALRNEIDGVLSSLCDHYQVTPAEERGVVVIRIEFL